MPTRNKLEVTVCLAQQNLSLYNTIIVHKASLRHADSPVTSPTLVGYVVPNGKFIELCEPGFR